MKKQVYQIIFLFFIITNYCYAQNLVINPGLENYITCPGFGQFDSTYINDWWKPTYGSTDYYHNNCSGIQPVNQTPHSGDAYFGIIAYNYGTEYREYATAKLSSPLIAGTQYTVQFYVSLNDGYIQAVNELGAYLSATMPGPYSNSLHIPVTPQVQNSGGALSSTSSWMLVSGTFTAAGGEQYITIGNFNDDLNTTITQVGTTGSFGAYYFVDDVSVSAEPNGIATYSKEQNSVFPNPAYEQLVISAPDNFRERTGISEIEINDTFGRRVYHSTFHTQHAAITIDISSLSKGIYFIKAGNELRKFVKE
jgi:hypothetical protein